MKRQRRAVSAVFFAHGLLLASWAPHIPYVKGRHGLSDGALGLVLLALAAGAVAAMTLSGPLSARVGPQVVTTWTTIAMAATLSLPPAAPNVALLVVALVTFGAALGSMDVAMNAVAADLGSRFGRSLMSSFHGMFSAGALAGSLLAAALLRIGIPPVVQAAAIGTVTATAIWPSLGVLPPSKLVGEARRPIRFPRGRLLVIGAMAFAILLGEGAVVDWSATLLRDVLGASSAVAALGFGAFSITMAIGRFAGDRINGHVGPARLLRTGACIATFGLGAGLLIGRPGSVIVGFALMGFGLANIVPVLFTAAAAAGPTPAEGISTAATLGYLGFLAGPPMIGALAEVTSLTAGLALVAALTAFVAVKARVVTPTNTPENAAVL